MGSRERFWRRRGRISSPISKMTATPGVGVLVTRPEPEASATAARIEALGFRAIPAPALEIGRLSRLRPADLVGAQAAVLTSAVSARAAADDLGGRPPDGLVAYCVGAKTAAAAQKAGFARVESGPGDAAGLLPLLSALNPAAGSLVLLRGRETATPLGPPLAARGFDVREFVLYGADRVAALPREALAGLDDGAARAALFLSARTVDAFLDLVREAGRMPALARVAALCNSARTAAPAERAGVFERVAIADCPTLDDTLKLLRATFRP